MYLPKPKLLGEVRVVYEAIPDLEDTPEYCWDIAPLVDNPPKPVLVWIDDDKTGAAYVATFAIAALGTTGTAAAGTVYGLMLLIVTLDPDCSMGCLETYWCETEPLEPYFAKPVLDWIEVTPGAGYADVFVIPRAGAR